MAAMSARPVVYLGPSARPEDVLSALPNAVLRPPIARGDLERDRLLRFSVFLIIDGVFAQEDALSPREVVDVLADGGAVIGAASMGALRAADCAPAGAIGIGAIYRLYRRGALSSEDDVAVSFLPDRGAQVLTLSLVSIRFALRRACRRGHVAHAAALQLMRAAGDLHYAQRTWRRIFAAAGMPEMLDTLRTRLDGTDVKTRDARHAARWLARKLRADPDWGDRPRSGPIATTGALRSRPVRSLDGRDCPKLQHRLCLWLLLTGRVNRYLGEGVTAITSGKKANPRAPNPALELARAGLVYGSTVHQLMRLTSELAQSGALEREYPRWSAVLAAAGSDVVPNRVDVARAGAQMARWHGVADWSGLAAKVDETTGLGAAGVADALATGLTEARRQIACGKAARREREEKGRSFNGN